MAALSWDRGYPLLEPDEGRNVEVAREMARDGDFVLPHLNGLPYLDKPATYFAVVATSLRVFGESESAARLPSLLFTLGSILVAWRLGRRIGPPGTGAFAAIALATMPLAFAFSRTVIFDPALAFLETLTLFAFWHALEGTPTAATWASFGWAVMGVGAVLKGPVAIIVPLLIIAAYGLMAGVRIRPVFRWSGWPWLFVTGLPWFLAVSLRRPDFPRYAFIYESLQRVATKSAGRGGPIWYFIPVALAGSFPWSVPAVAAAVRAWRSHASRKSAEGRVAVFLFAWAVMPLLFFSLSQSKLPGYYLPALPALALAAGLLIARAEEDERSARYVRNAARVAAAIMLAIGVAFWMTTSRVAAKLPTQLQRETWPSFATTFAVVLVVTGAALAAGSMRRRIAPLVVALAFPVIALSFGGTRLLRAIGEGRSSKSLAARIDAVSRDAAVIGVSSYPTSLRYYLDRPVILSSATGVEMTSNYIVSRLDEFSSMPGSPLRPADYWRTSLAGCTSPAIFIVHVRTPEDTLLAARLPLIGRGGADEKFAAYGPCSAPAHAIVPTFLRSYVPTH